MQLLAWAQALDAGLPLPPGSLSFWLGAFDTPAAPDLTRLLVTVDGQRAPLIGPPVSFRPLRDGSGQRWHTRLIVAGPASRPQAHGGRVVPQCVRFVLDGVDAECLTLPLPARVPDAGDGAFRVVLSSCYSAPQDPGRRLARLMSALPRPDLAVLAGDQVYLDLPVTEDLPENETRLRAVLGEKYRRNFVGVPGAQSPGLGALLAAAPVVCLADDHEFWNNYPYPQAQLPDTWTKHGRERWQRVARELYEDYQCSDRQAATRAVRLDIAPLKLLFVDLRSRRREADGKAGELFDDTSRAVFDQWLQALLDARASGGSPVGLLSSGQILFRETPGWFGRTFVDAEMAHYRDFDHVHDALHRLALAGVPVLYISGDVHWGRIARAVHAARPGWPALTEVIASPSVQIKGKRSATPTRPKTFGPAGAGNRYQVERAFPSDDRALGDHVALLEFAISAGRLTARVTVHPVPADGAAGIPIPTTRDPLDLGPPRSLTR